MRYLLPCECGRDLPVATSQAGETVVCECGREHQAPKLRELRLLPPAPEAEPEAKPRRRLAWSMRQGVMFSVGAVLLLLAAGVLILTSLQRSQLNPYTEKPELNPEFMEQYLAEIDENEPAENLEVWQTEVLEEGLAREHDPPYLHYRRIEGHLNRRAAIAAVGGLIGLGLIVAAFLYRPTAKSGKPTP